MRKMPQLQPGNQSVQMTSAFRGYNHNDIIADGEMYDMQNLSGDRYPLLTLRDKRGISSWDIPGADPVPLTGIHGRDQLVFVRGTKVYYNFTEVAGLSVSADPTMCPKRIVSMGAYVCIWPDKKYFNTANSDDYGNMGHDWTGNGEDISLAMCRADGTNYDTTQIIVNSDPPADPSNGDFWIDESGDADVLRQYYSATMEWIEVATTYVKIGGTGIGHNLKEYDVAEVSGLVYGGLDDKLTAQVEALNGSKIIYAAGEDYIVVAGLLSQTMNAGDLAAGNVLVSLNVPDLDFVCESNNRLWGCRYGAVGGQIVNEIHCSKLGDFRNWNCYMGLSTDSWTAGVGTDGPFTGAITQRGYPVFFKENCIHRVSGTVPSNFSIQTTMARGVQRGCERSLVVVNENIYYKARNAVMVYDGNMPQGVSDQLGKVLYSDARAGVLGNKYYISMKDKNSNWQMFAYDTKYGTWYKEDYTKALGFGAADDELYYIDEDANTLVSVTGSVAPEQDTGATKTVEPDFEWAAEFGLTGVNYVQSSSYDSPARIRNAKYLSMFKIRMYLAPESVMRLWIKYDDNPLYELLGERHGSELRTFVLPVIPKRCDHLRFKITGKGEMKVYDISRVMEVGGDG